MVSRFVSLALLLSACSSDDGSIPDGGPDVADVTTHDASVDADAAIVDASFERPGLPIVPNVGSHTLHDPTLVTILASNDDMVAELEAFSGIVPQSSFWSAISTEYGLGSIKPGATLVGPAISAGTYSTAQLTAYVTGVLSTMADGGLTPNGETIYLLYLPSGASYSGTFANDCGYHTGYPSGMSTGDQLATVIRCTPYQDQETQLGELTRVATHEIAESATDPLGQGYDLGLLTAKPWTANVWSQWVSAGHVELGDLCEGTRIYESLDGGPDGGWEYQRIWSNAGASSGGDPCAPAAASPYESVATPSGWFVGTPGADVTIPIEGWSVATTIDWLVYARITVASAGFQPLTNASLSITTDLGVGTSGLCLTRQAINSGHPGTLTVPVPSSAASGDYVVVAIDSFREKPSPSCWPPLTEDDYHFSVVGVHVP